jgi:hypothetical protein
LWSQSPASRQKQLTGTDIFSDLSRVFSRRNGTENHYARSLLIGPFGWQHGIGARGKRSARGNPESLTGSHLPDRGHPRATFSHDLKH